MNDWKNIFIWLFILIALANAFLIGRRVGKQGQEEVIRTQVDTLVIRDTIRINEPVIVERRVVDTMTIEVPDYLVVHDTAYVNLPREEVEYRDTSYRAIISGFLPRLEEIEIYRQDRVVTIETTRTIKERSHWGLGVQAGAGISTQGLVPYVGIGVSYNILTW
jgi:hypothetical protein